MYARSDREGSAQRSVDVVVPADTYQTSVVGAEDGRDETNLATWLAKLVRYTLYGEVVGIVLRSERAMPPRLIAAAGVASGNCAVWWNQLCVDIPDLGTNEEFISYPKGHYTYTEGDPITATTAHRIVRLVLPLLVGERRLGVLLVEFRFGERIVSDVLVTARALAHLVSIALDHERLSREHEEMSGATKQLRQEKANMEEALTQTVHELRAPLTTMKMGMEIAERQLGLVGERSMLADSAPVHVARATTAIKLASRSADTGERLLSDLADTTQIRTGLIAMRPARCDLAAIVQEAVARQRIAWPRWIIHLEVPDETVPVMGDADRISQVVCNYLTNALKYSSDFHPVEVRLNAGSGEACVTVRDRGIGIAPEQQRHVWERFYQTNAYSKHSTGGLGIGLFICRQFVAQMGGSVGVQSDLGKGSTFWFTIPLDAG